MTAMHVPEGSLNAPTSAATAVLGWNCPGAFGCLRGEGSGRRTHPFRCRWRTVNMKDGFLALSSGRQQRLLLELLAVGARAERAEWAMVSMAGRRGGVAVFTLRTPRSRSVRGSWCRRDGQWTTMTEPFAGGKAREDAFPQPASPPALDHQPAPPRGQVLSGNDNGDNLADLLRRSGGGDEAAFAVLYDATASKVYGLAARVTRSPEIAAEVVQEVYLMAWQQAARFDSARGTVLGWLCTLAHRRAVDRVRHVARERDREQTYENRHAGTPSDHTWQEVKESMETREVRAGLDALTPLQREAVSLAYYDGCTHQEVAQRLEIPLGTAKARIRDGLNRLRSVLEVQR